MSQQKTIEAYMTPSPLTIGVDQPLSRAREVMQEHGVRHLPVLNGGRLVGLVSERDVSLIEGLRDVDPSGLSVEEAMSSDVFSVTSDATLAQVAQEMAERKYGSAVVMKSTKVIGIFTTVDACAALARFAAGPGA